MVPSREAAETMIESGWPLALKVEPEQGLPLLASVCWPHDGGTFIYATLIQIVEGRAQHRNPGEILASLGIGKGLASPGISKSP